MIRLSQHPHTPPGVYHRAPKATKNAFGACLNKTGQNCINCVSTHNTSPGKPHRLGIRKILRHKNKKSKKIHCLGQGHLAEYHKTGPLLCFDLYKWADNPMEPEGAHGHQWSGLIVATCLPMGFCDFLLLLNDEQKVNGGH